QLNQRYSDYSKAGRKTDLQNKINATASVIKARDKKGVYEVYEEELNRIQCRNYSKKEKSGLSESQQKAMGEIRESFQRDKVALLFGVRSSGKTELYIQLSEEAISQGKQVLYLLPEIALTTQIIVRLQRVFGDKVGVYHSRYNENERVEVWNEVLNFEKNKNSGRFQVILGARSALFLPYSSLGLVIVDEEHENTFKQYDPSPRYHARDSAIVLA